MRSRKGDTCCVTLKPLFHEHQNEGPLDCKNVPFRPEIHICSLPAYLVPRESNAENLWISRMGVPNEIWEPAVRPTPRSAAVGR